MTLLDAACLVALFRAEPGAGRVAEVITSGAAISVINRAEVIDRLARQGADPAEVGADIDMLDLEHHDVTRQIADSAAALRSRHYHRTRRQISLSDCIAAATAQHLGRPLATSDQHLADLAAIIGIHLTAVANSRGERPTAAT